MPTRPPECRIRRRSGLAWLVSALLLSAGAALAEDPPAAAPPAAKTEEQPPAAIAIPEIAIRSEQVTSLLRAIEAALEKDPVVDSIAQELPQLVDGNLTLLAETNRLLEQGPRKRVLEAVTDAWASERARSTSSCSAGRTTSTKGPRSAAGWRSICIACSATRASRCPSRSGWCT